jgi:hypothetical protein
MAQSALDRARQVGLSRDDLIAALEATEEVT